MFIPRPSPLPTTLEEGPSEVGPGLSYSLVYLQSLKHMWHTVGAQQMC